MSFHRPSTSNAALRTAAGAVAAGVGALAWGTLVERNWYALRRLEVPVLAPGSAPLRVLHVSDLHIVPRQERRIQWVRELARLEPDFVINTGDNLSDEDAIPSALRAMEPLMAFPGAFVFGSNDYFYPKLKNPLRYFDDSHAKGEEMGVGRFDVEPLRETARIAALVLRNLNRIQAERLAHATAMLR